jgi:hypothetical protein
MISQIQLTTLVIVATFIWGITLIVQGVSVTGAWLRPYSTVVGVLPLLLLIFDKWLWRLSFLHGWFVKIPDLQGTWRAGVRSSWHHGDAEPQQIEGFMVMRQTYSSISMRFYTAESASELVACRITRSEDSVCEVVGVYQNVPRLLTRTDSPVHFGGLILRVQGDPVYALEGQYWTDRRTLGEIHLSDRQPKLHYDFTSAQRAFSETNLKEPPK